MLQGISPLISPDLLDALFRMGHGDTIVLADAHFPGESVGERVVRADGIGIAALLEAVLPLFPLDTYVEAPLAMMAAVPGDELDPQVEAGYRAAIGRSGVDSGVAIERIDRFAFYDRAGAAYAVVMTGETAKYGNIMLTKGLVLAD